MTFLTEPAEDRRGRVYVAAPYADAAQVRALHDLLRQLGIEPTSTWAEQAKGEENLESLSLAKRRTIAVDNDLDLTSSDVVLALARPGAGGEMFCEIRMATLLDIPVVYVGARRVLSAYRPGVTIAADLEAGIAEVQAMLAKGDG